MRLAAGSRWLHRARSRLRADPRAFLVLWRRLAPPAYVTLLAVLFPAVYGGGDADAHAYYQAAAFPTAIYAHPMAGTPDAYLYAPPFAQALAPLAALGWPAFAVAWYALLGTVLWWLAREWAPLLLVVPVAYPWSPAGVVLPVLREIQVGNVEFLYAATFVVLARRPALWALPLLTKPTLGVGLVWYAARREWRGLGVALGATAGIAAVSAALDPGAWVQWAALLAANARDSVVSPSDAPFTFLPLAPRLAGSLLLVAWGARSDRSWTLVVGAVFALPIFWQASPVLLLGLLPLARQRRAVAQRQVGGDGGLPAS